MPRIEQLLLLYSGCAEGQLLPSDFTADGIRYVSILKCQVLLVWFNKKMV